MTPGIHATRIGRVRLASASSEKLRMALQALPRAEPLPPDELTDLVHLIKFVSLICQERELPECLTASVAASDRELAKLADLCTGLVKHIETMHHPAVSRLMQEGVNLTPLVSSLRETAEGARHVHGRTGAPEYIHGRPRKLAASVMTDFAASTFEAVTGQPATYTSDPSTSEVRGAWPKFLSRVFEALGFNASAAAQVKACRKRKAGDEKLPIDQIALLNRILKYRGGSLPPGTEKVRIVPIGRGENKRYGIFITLAESH